MYGTMNLKYVGQCLNQLCHLVPHPTCRHDIIFSRTSCWRHHQMQISSHAFAQHSVSFAARFIRFKWTHANLNKVSRQILDTQAKW